MYNNLALVENQLGHHDDAIAAAQDAIEIFGKTIGIFEPGSEGDMLQALGTRLALDIIGDAHLRLNQPTQALNYFQQALTLAEEINDQAGQATILTHTGAVYQSQGDLVKALDFYRRALVIHDTVGNESGMGATFHAMGTALFELQQWPQAEEQLYNAIARWENLRPGLQDEYKVSLADLQSQTYELLQRVLIAQHKTNEALELAERGRGRAFIELLATNFKENPPAIAPPSIAEIQAIAQQQQATLVEYALSDEEVYMWVINPDGEIAFRSVSLSPILGSRSLEALVKSTRDGMFIEPYYPGEELQTLHEILITPIADLLPTDPEEKIIFIPQDSLFLVPFVALLDEEERYLIQSHTLLTAPSIQVLALTHQQQAQNRQTNPTNSLVVGFPRDPQMAKDLVLGNPTMPINLQTGSPLAPLSGAEEEAQQIATFLDTKALIGAAATKAEVIQTINSSRIVHIATHGLLEDMVGLGTLVL
ncbi:MAG: CHAT domain-containing protein [Synechococcaceae cyanobacterium RL_1_2]|nr:CHAT domain-containing protein [Synechococcaceae cyanobacterium RL_1_2]